MNDDVTVVITNYDYGAFLEEAVASALGQEGGAPRETRALRSCSGERIRSSSRISFSSVPVYSV